MEVYELIKVENLVKTYESKNNRVEAIKGISLNVEKGEIFGIIGLSGAGKSSLVKIISTVERATSGDIYINDTKMDFNKPNDILKIRKSIGMIFQHFNLLMNRTVYENIAFPLEILKQSKKDIDKRVNELLELVGLTDKKDEYPSDLSGGQKQRVGIARALAKDPEILICDEATSALDPVTTAQVLDLLKEINQKFNITILMITHEMEVIKEMCSKVAVLENGKLIEQNDVVSVFVKPETETSKIFFENVTLNTDNKVYKKIFSKNTFIVKVTFIGSDSVEPFINNAIKKFDVDIAILAGNIQEINNTIIGMLVIEIDGNKKQIDDTLKFFDEQKLIVEVMQ